MNNVQQEYIIPGQVTEDGPTTQDRAYWRVLCPKCGQVHEREIKTYWEDDKDFGGIVMHHYFVCMETGTHFRLEANVPFGVVMEHRFREQMKPGSELPDDKIPF